MTMTIFLGSLLGSMVLGTPIAFALLISGVALMIQLNMFDSLIIAQNLINGADSFPLMAVPFFILAGELMNAGGFPLVLSTLHCRSSDIYAEDWVMSPSLEASCLPVYPGRLWPIRRRLAQS